MVAKTDEHSVSAYQKIVSEGHTLAMHSYSHKYEEIYSSKESFIEDVEKNPGLPFSGDGRPAGFLPLSGGGAPIR